MPRGRLAVIRDVTERDRHEDKVRVSEIRYRRLFEAAHDGVLLLDPVTGKIIEANPFMTRMLGYPHDYLIGKELFEIGLLKDAGASQEMFRKLKIANEVRYENLPLEGRDGQHQEVEVVANLYDENGRPVIQCNIRDITERKRCRRACQAAHGGGQPSREEPSCRGCRSWPSKQPSLAIPRHLRHACPPASLGWPPVRTYW